MTQSDKNSFNKKLAIHGSLFLAGCALFAAMVWMGDGFDLRKLSNVRLWSFFWSVVITGGTTLLVAIRWGSLANSIGSKPLPLIRYYNVFATTSFLSFILPKDIVDIGGRALWMKKKAGHTYTTAGTTLFWDRLLDGIVLIALLPTCMAYFFGGQKTLFCTALAAVSIAVAGFLLWYLNQWTFRAIQTSFNAIIKLFGTLPILGKRLPETLDLPPIERRLCLNLFVLSAIKPLILSVQYALFAYAIGLDFSLSVMVFGTPLSQLAFLFAFTAGGLGVFEAGWFSILALGGIPSEDIGVFLIAQRIFSITALAIVAGTAQIYSMISTDTD